MRSFPLGRGKWNSMNIRKQTRRTAAERRNVCVCVSSLGRTSRRFALLLLITAQQVVGRSKGVVGKAEVKSDIRFSAICCVWLFCRRGRDGKIKWYSFLALVLQTGWKHAISGLIWVEIGSFEVGIESQRRGGFVRVLLTGVCFVYPRGTGVGGWIVVFERGDWCRQWMGTT